MAAAMHTAWQPDGQTRGNFPSHEYKFFWLRCPAWKDWHMQLVAFPLASTRRGRTTPAHFDHTLSRKLNLVILQLEQPQPAIRRFALRLRTRWYERRVPVERGPR